MTTTAAEEPRQAEDVFPAADSSLPPSPSRSDDASNNNYDCDGATETAAGAAQQSAARSATASEKPVSTVIGIDVGAFSSVVCSASTRTLASHILRNDMSNQSTPSMVAILSNEFPSGDEKVEISEKRLLGESAAQSLTSNYKKTSLSVLANVEERDGEDVADVKSRVGRLGALFSHLSSFVNDSGNSAILSADGGHDPSARVECGIVVPDTFSAASKSRVEDAARVAGIRVRSIVDQSAALALVYGTRKAQQFLETNRRVLFVNVGHAYASASVFEFDGSKAAKRLAAKSQRGIAGSAVDDAIFAALAKEAKEKHSIDIKEGSKGAVRLSKQVSKLKKTLSSVPKAGVTVENLGMDRDVAFKYTRAELETLCQDIAEKLESLVKSAVEQARGDESADDFLESLLVEVLGGGARVPCVEAAISRAVNGKQLMHTLDSLSACAKGAAYGVAKLHEPQGALHRPIFDTLAFTADGISEFGACRGECADDAVVLSEADVEAACALEEKHRAHETLVADTLAAKNSIEQYVYEMRAALRGSRPHSELIEKDACGKILDEIEQWQWDEDGGASPFMAAATFQSKLSEIKNALETGPCSAYLAKVEEEKKKEEERLRVAAEQAAKEKEASGESDDHDFRKLKKPERMRKVKMNKAEGTELFKDKNYEYAMKRYKRALLHCTKFFDLDEESKKEVKAVELALHNNVSMCATKLENWALVFEHTKHALDIDESCVKALYRRAFAQEKTKKFDDAKKILSKAAKLAPEDKSVAKLSARVEAQLKRQKAKQRKMAKKMFG